MVCRLLFHQVIQANTIGVSCEEGPESPRSVLPELNQEEFPDKGKMSTSLMKDVIDESLDESSKPFATTNPITQAFRTSSMQLFLAFFILYYVLGALALRVEADKSRRIDLNLVLGFVVANFFFHTLTMYCGQLCPWLARFYIACQGCIFLLFYVGPTIEGWCNFYHGLVSDDKFVITKTYRWVSLLGSACFLGLVAVYAKCGPEHLPSITRRGFMWIPKSRAAIAVMLLGHWCIWDATWTLQCTISLILLGSPRFIGEACYTFDFLVKAYVLLVSQRTWRIALLAMPCGYFLTVFLKATVVGDLPLIDIIMAFVNFFFPCLITGIWRYAMYWARQALIPAFSNYRDAWTRASQDEQAITAFENTVAHFRASHQHLVVGEFTQPKWTFEDMLFVAGRVNDWYQDLVESWCSYLGATHHRSKPKSRQRTIEKIIRAYKGETARVLDLVRSTIEVETIAQVDACFKYVVEQCNVLRLKNRFTLDYNDEESLGYRDVNMIISLPELEETDAKGFLFELQINISGFLRQKKAEGHKKYVYWRNISGC